MIVLLVDISCLEEICLKEIKNPVSRLQLRWPSWILDQHERYNSFYQFDVSLTNLHIFIKVV